ncbi:MAG: hypothetical protein CMD67_01770 [Gammaproteobacteria bacterium]|jgi:acyl-CoA dehydrogenase|nr:hypothetical protein [Gammaproteobacteria bacterium]|tara:strand:+ start:111 stop:1106 length:996 start_codon:yes stop_codon:yes gene_type:complete
MTDTVRIVNESAHRLFKEIIQKKDLDQAEAGFWPENLWQAVKQAGYIEAWDENNIESREIGLTLAQLSGWHALPIPLVETMAARNLAIRYLKFCPDGPLTIANPFLLKDCSIKNDKLIGIATGVPFARHVKNIVTVIDGNLILAPSLISHEGLNMAGEVRDNIFWKEAEVIVGPKVSQETVMEKGALMRSAQICGALQHALDKSTNYATERKQFGRSLSKFQTIQNYLAKMASLTAMAEAALSNAIHLESTRTIATAKSCASEAGGEVASLAHRIHGAIGFTHEYSLHHLTRRLLSWREEFGAESWWHDRLGRIAIKAGSDNLWAMITSKH